MNISDPIIGQEKIKNLLTTTFRDIRSRNGSFSLRMFARRLGIQAPVVSEVMNGKRLISRKLAEKILLALKVDEVEKHSLLSHFPEKQVRDKKSNKALLDAESFRVISDWWYMAILSLAETPDCQANPSWIAERFNITTEQAQEAIHTLERLSLLTICEGRLVSSGKYLRFSSSIPDDSIRKHHRQGLDLAYLALADIELEFRDFGSMTFKADPQLLEVARKKLRAARTEISALMNTPNASQVYRLQMQLFPLTKQK